MRRPMIVFLFLLVVVVFGLVVYLSEFSETSDKTATDNKLQTVENYPINKVIRFRLTARNPEQSILKTPEFWMLVPLKQTATQKRISIQATQNYTLETDKAGNDWMHVKLSDMAPGEQRVITVTVQLAMSDKPNKLLNEKLESLVLGAPYIEVSSPEIQRVAKRIKQQDVTKTALSTYKWVQSNVDYTGYLREPRGANYAITSKKGDCTEFAYLYTALLRANRIPSRSLMGFVYENNAMIDVTDIHDWSEYYSNNTWHLVDPQGNTFEKNQSHYVAMRVNDHNVISANGDNAHIVRSGQGLQVTLNRPGR